MCSQPFASPNNSPVMQTTAISFPPPGPPQMSGGTTPGPDAPRVLTNCLFATPTDYTRFLNAMSLWRPPAILNPAVAPLPPPPPLPQLIGGQTCYGGPAFQLDPMRPFHPLNSDIRMPFFREEPKPNHSYIGKDLPAKEYANHDLKTAIFCQPGFKN